MTKSTSVMVFPPKRGFSLSSMSCQHAQCPKNVPQLRKYGFEWYCFFRGASRQCRGRRSLAQGCRNIASVDFFGEQKRRQCRYPAVSARQTPLFERKSAAPSIVNIIAVRQAATGYGAERISERAPAFSALFARLILTKSYRYGIFSLCGALCAACFRCHLRGEEG